MTLTKEAYNLLISLQFKETAESLANLLENAQHKKPAYVDFLIEVLTHEKEARNDKALARRLKQAHFPYYKTLNEFSLAEQPSLSRQQFNQLQSLDWVDWQYNLILLGPTGTGKTSLSIGLGIRAIQQGYKVGFVTMGELIRLLKTQDIFKKAAFRIEFLKKTQLLILDDLMFLALNKTEANLLFHFINDIFEETAIILTSNKEPESWGELIGDEIIAAAILDRIVAKSEIIQLRGESYRLKHRETLFDRDESNELVNN